ncbi:unnamed protein product [Aureobasidium mustum]|uniref:Uncharacterized protein n=1 Tax=Aureobasidium mustum TaxID=2773714 RepID=A0A9N8PHS8_9PEZI|nr:unnamed protein product [Aureobasidium mustum]
MVQAQPSLLTKKIKAQPLQGKHDELQRNHEALWNTAHYLDQIVEEDQNEILTRRTKARSCVSATNEEDQSEVMRLHHERGRPKRGHASPPRTRKTKARAKYASEGDDQLSKLNSYTDCIERRLKSEEAKATEFEAHLGDLQGRNDKLTEHNEDLEDRLITKEIKAQAFKAESLQTLRNVIVEVQTECRLCDTWSDSKKCWKSEAIRSRSQEAVDLFEIGAGNQQARVQKWILMNSSSHKRSKLKPYRLSTTSFNAITKLHEKLFTTSTRWWSKTKEAPWRTVHYLDEMVEQDQRSSMKTVHYLDEMWSKTKEALEQDQSEVMRLRQGVVYLKKIWESYEQQ